MRQTGLMLVGVLLFTACAPHESESSRLTGAAFAASRSLDDPSPAPDENGDTPLGRALIEGRPEDARRLIAATGPEGLKHRNHGGEGYVYLAARAGYPDLVAAIAQKHFETLGALGRYNFSRLDRRSRLGRRGLFVAANRAVAETLEAQHYRGFLKYPWRDFMLERDKLGQNFLHAAAADGRDDVVSWATERLCPAGRWEQSKRFYKRLPARGATYSLALAQTYVIGDVRWWWDKVVNRQDKSGRTPLHVALEHHQWQTVRALAHCRWLDFDLQTHRGDLPLHVFLAHLDSDVSRHDPEVYGAFDFLIAQDTRLRLRTLTSRLRVTNRDGETPLHLAARLADPYFYTRLSRVGDVYGVNGQGMTAERMFANRQRQTRAREP